MTRRELDVVCLGRAAVDLYGQQVGGRLEDMQTFAKYLGGSSANLAAGLARLGVRSAMLARVGDDHMGRFVREELARQGVDVRFVRTDPDRLTALVILGIGSADDIPHIFFRERCADMGVTEDDVDEGLLASSHALAITGTHLSTSSTRTAVQRAMTLAVKHGTRVVLDIDYRPVLWGLAAAGDGASRYIESDEASTTIQSVLPDCDLVVGTEEEIAIAGGSTDLLEALRGIRSRTGATIVLKRGAAGCTVFDGGKLDSLDDGTVVAGREVDVFNTVGAGDSFLSGFLSGWLEDRDWHECGRRGNGCGALVVSRHGCTPAMPSRVELDLYLSDERPPLGSGGATELDHVHRATTGYDDPRPLCILAFDHRTQFLEMARENGRSVADIARFKELIAEVLLDIEATGDDSVRYGAIIDHRYGASAMRRLSGTSVWMGSPIEVPGSRPLQFDPPFSPGRAILTWPADRVVKCLLFYHPDDPETLRHAQEERVRSLHAEIVALERRLVLEILCPPIDGPAHPSPLPRAMRRFYNLGVRPDWWKLEPQTAEGWEAIGSVIAECDPYCRGVLILGLGAEEQPLRQGLAAAASFDVCRGFAVGRSIFADAAGRWFAGTASDEDAQESVRHRYRSMIDTWIGAGAPAVRGATLPETR